MWQTYVKALKYNGVKEVVELALDSKGSHWWCNTARREESEIPEEVESVLISQNLLPKDIQHFPH